MINKVYAKIKLFFKENYKFLIGLAIIIFLFYFELPFIIYRSGGTINLKNRIKIDTNYEEKGSFSMSYVNAMKGTPAFILLSYLLPDWDLYPIDEITNGDSYEDTIAIGKVYLKEGIDNAKIAAFKEAGKNINITKTINTVIYLSDEASTNIKIGDIILQVNEIDINELDDIKEAIKDLKVGDIVKVKVLRDEKEMFKEATIYEDIDNTLKIGVALKTSYEFTTDIDVDIKMKNNESGSSGGLMMSLAIFNALTDKDLTKGLNIVGTGTIDSDGNVGEIGGVKYKVLGANKKKADIFFCPMENLEEAKSIKEKRNLDIKIVGVSTLKEAIEYLENYQK